ncbi:MAG: TRAP transporter substrate-binding protein DctP [Acidobacteria bacterium]|nr:TRAP transporter substrate-binding protein DctP [Acidobacteriota bacterium]
MTRATVRFLAIILCLATALAGRTGRAQGPVALKLGTILPDGTIWSKILKDQAAEWQQLTQGRVTMRVLAGTQGDEPTILRKMRTAGQLQAGALSAIGLGDLDPAFNVFGVPLFYDSYDELAHVMDKLTPILKAKLDAKDFVLVNWGVAGWVQVFSKRPVKNVKDLKSLKIFTSAGDDRMVQWYKANGFNPVPLAPTDVLPMLSTGTVEAVPTTPLTALSFQWYKQTPYMLDAGLSPLIGATIVLKKTWNEIAEADRAKLLDAAGRVEKRMRDEVPKRDASAVTEMQARGLAVTKIDPSSQTEWKPLADAFVKSMSTEQVPRDVFDLALRERDAFRKQHPPAR